MLDAVGSATRRAQLVSIILLTGSALLVTTVSLYSGWEKRDFGFEHRWRVTPLALLGGSYTDLYGARAICSFAGAFSGTWDYVGVFLRTVALETPLFLIATRSAPLGLSLSLAVAANALTHPLIYFALPCTFESFIVYLAVAESFAPCAEAIFVCVFARRLGGVSVPQCAALVLAANLLSWQVGVFF